MCLKELLDALRQKCPVVTVAQVRWAIATGKVSRPPLDGSLRFNFDACHLAQLLDYFARRAAPGLGAEADSGRVREEVFPESLAGSPPQGTTPAEAGGRLWR